MAYAPYSNFLVGAALEMRRGREVRIFTGCNVENASYGATICAERTALLKGVSEGFREILKVVVVGPEPIPPCGLCLQTMSEFATAHTQVWMTSPKVLGAAQTFRDIFPAAFSKDSVLKNSSVIKGNTSK